MNAGGSSLNHDPTSDQDTYVWKSEGSWAGTCRQLQVKLVDGNIAVFAAHLNGGGVTAEPSKSIACCRLLMIW